MEQTNSVVVSMEVIEFLEELVKKCPDVIEASFVQMDCAGIDVVLVLTARSVSVVGLARIQGRVVLHDLLGSNVASIVVVSVAPGQVREAIFAGLQLRAMGGL